MHACRPLFALLPVFCTVCQPRPLAPVGVTHDRQASTTDPAAPTSTDTTRVERWRHAPDYMRWPLVASYASLGHAGAQRAELRTQPAALDTLTNWSRGQALPEGSVIVQAHMDDLGALQRLFTMTKLPDQWRFEAFDAAGIPLQLSEQRCDQCHRQATSDSVFGPPRQ